MRGWKANPPRWVVALQLAEAWGVPPWQIYNHPHGLRWAARWAAYQRQRERSRKLDEQKARHQREQKLR